MEHAKDHMREIGNEIRKNGLPGEMCPVIVGFAGYGNVSSGAQELFNLLPVKTITPDKLGESRSTAPRDNHHLIKVVFKEHDLVMPKSGRFDLQDYYDHPEKYVPVTERLLPHLDILVNCIYWTDKYPRLVTKKHLRDNTKSDGTVEPYVIGDISCDIEGAVEITKECTTPDRACFTYLPDVDEFIDSIAGEGVTVMAVDNLPCEFPMESSEYFSGVLKNYVDAIVSADFNRPLSEIDLPHPIKKALILHNGELTDGYTYVLDPFKFKISRDSWNKTDKQDARNMAKVLWIYMVTGEFGIPTVYKPSMEIRELRTLFCQYRLFTRQITMLKNNIQAIFTDNGVDLKGKEKALVLSRKDGGEALSGYEVSPASRISLRLNLDLLWRIEEQKEEIKKEILLAGEPFSYEVKLLITVKGITPLSALAFLADVADFERFKTLRKMNAYLDLVQKVRESGGKSKPGHINRASRSLTRTILTQSVIHFAQASPQLGRYYNGIAERRGAGRARIALIRKVCGTMRRMLLNGEQFRGMKKDNFERKWKRYENQLKKIKKERKIA